MTLGLTFPPAEVIISKRHDDSDRGCEQEVRNVRKVALGVVLPLLFLASLAMSQDKPVVAVVDFRSLGVEEYVGQTIAEIIRTELIGTEKFTVLERGALEKVLAEQELSMSGVADEQTAVRVGKLVGAKFVMVGSISKLGSNYILNSRLIDVESGRGTLGKSAEGKSEDDLSKMARQIVLAVAGGEETHLPLRPLAQLLHRRWLAWAQPTSPPTRQGLRWSLMEPREEPHRLQ
jgi:TolB-like protein